MSIQIPSDVWQRVESLFATGEYASEAEVLRDALAALEHRRDDLAAIQEGI